MPDPHLICVHCGVPLRTAEFAAPDPTIGYWHDLRLEPWDHPPEPGLSTEEPADPPPACGFCAAPAAWAYRGAGDGRSLTVEEHGDTVRVVPDFEIPLDQVNLPGLDTAPILQDLLFMVWLAYDPCSVMVADKNAAALLARALRDRPALHPLLEHRALGTINTFLAFVRTAPAPL
ncbi:hypothetical protein ACQEU3_03435 [Spirillospora sp. CA-253888]